MVKPSTRSAVPTWIECDLI